ncbi:unnamed protein product [Diplocarpon coronariae]
MIDYSVSQTLNSVSVYLKHFLGTLPVTLLPLAAAGVTVTSERLGNVTSSNTENIRDLGFSGTIGNVTLNTYGDTLTCGSGSAWDRYFQSPSCALLHANSAAFAGPDPMNITDFNLDETGNSRIFCGYFPDETPESSYGMGITNVIALPGSDTEGALYFLKNYRPAGVDMIVGAGLALVNISGAYPTCQRTSENWWNASEPQYGDHGQLLAQDDWIYVYGGADSKKYYDGVYVVRVPHAQQQDLTAYEYWNGTSFSKEGRFYNPTAAQAVLGPGSTQGTISWNPHLKAYLYVYTSGAEVRGKIASNPEGPFSDSFSIHNTTDFKFVYSPSQQTHYDPSGKTLVISYTGFPNIIQAFKAVSPLHLFSYHGGHTVCIMSFR